MLVLRGASGLSAGRATDGYRAHACGDAAAGLSAVHPKAAPQAHAALASAQ